jgi:hypothetical protein
MREKISSNYDIKTFVFDYRKTYETIYFVFHFVIMQHIKFCRESVNLCDILLVLIIDLII